MSQSISEDSPISEDPTLVKGDKKNTKVDYDDIPSYWFCRMIEDHTTAMCCGGIFTLIFLTLIGVAVTVFIRGDFSIGEAGVGFEPRGNDLSGRLLALRYYIPYGECKGQLSTYSDGNTSGVFAANAQEDSEDSKLFKNCVYTQVQLQQSFSVSNLQFNTLETSFFQSQVIYPEQVVSPSNTFAVDDGREETISLIFVKTGSTSDLFTTAPLKGMCQLDTSIRSYSGFDPTYCRRDFNGMGSTGCAPSRSLGNYVAALQNKTLCDDITDADVTEVKALLSSCRSFYDAQSLKGNCWNYNTGSRSEESDCSANVPLECLTYNAVYDIFNAVAESDFMRSGKTTLGTAKLLVPIDQSNENWLVDLYNDVVKKETDKSFGGAKLVAYGMEIKGTLFFQIMIGDSYLIALVFLALFLIMFYHTSSFIISLLTFYEILMAFGFAFTLYNAVLWIPFFPFLNLVSVFLVVGIGADDVFVYFDAWKQSFELLPEDCSIAQRTSWVLRRAGSAMLVTSITTAASFFANAISPITAIKTFGIYSGLVIVCDFVFMTTFLPIVVVWDYKYNRNLRLKESWTNTKYIETAFSKYIGPTVNKFNYVFIILFLGIGGGIGYNAMNLERPSSNYMQLLDSSHPMEKYEKTFIKRFNNDGEDSGDYRLQFIFGIKPEDNGDYLDPYDYGTIQYNVIDVFSPESQTWVNDFCFSLANQTFSGIEIGNANLYNVKCFVVWVNQWLMTSCNSTENRSSPDTETFQTPLRTTCCDYESSDFPLPSSEFESCSKVWANEYGDFDTGLWFDPIGAVKAFVIEAPSNVKNTETYEPAKTFYKNLNDFTKTQLANAPTSSGLRKGFFSSELSFYNLQKSISEGAYQSAGLSCILALAVILFMTMDLIASFFASFSITLIVLCVTGSIVLAGWELNVVESIVFSMAVGLSVDFCAHFGHSFVSSKHALREHRVQQALEELGISVSMGALTTAITGGFLLMARVVFYQQFGTFLTLIMAFSFFFAVFFLMSALSLVGVRSDILPLITCGRFGRSYEKRAATAGMDPATL